MLPTKNSLPEKVRVQITAVLQDRLVDSLHLTLQAKQAHWNVKGPSFLSLHELFDKVSEDAEGYADLLAERIVQLGGVAVGTLKPGEGKSTLPAYALSITGGKEHVAALTYALAFFGESVRQTIGRADEIKDPVTADILTEISRSADKNLWLVDAHGFSKE